MAVAVNDMRILARITPERLAAHGDRVRHAAAMVVDCNLMPDALAWLFAQRQTTPVLWIVCRPSNASASCHGWGGCIRSRSIGWAQFAAAGWWSTDAAVEQAARLLRRACSKSS